LSLNHERGTEQGVALSSGKNGIKAATANRIFLFFSFFLQEKIIPTGKGVECCPEVARDVDLGIKSKTGRNRILASPPK
jgi:hypothetical protein